jgi:hypothetical protein
LTLLVDNLPLLADYSFGRSQTELLKRSYRYCDQQVQVHDAPTKQASLDDPNRFGPI